MMTSQEKLPVRFCFNKRNIECHDQIQMCVFVSNKMMKETRSISTSVNEITIKKIGICFAGEPIEIENIQQVIILTMNVPADC